MEIERDTPIRLARAAELAFPDSGITASALRKQRDAGRLKTWLVANKEFTSLAEIDAMFELCKLASPSRSRASSQPVMDPERQAEIALAAALARCARPPRRR